MQEDRVVTGTDTVAEEEVAEEEEEEAAAVVGEEEVEVIMEVVAVSTVLTVNKHDCLKRKGRVYRAGSVNI